MDDFASDASTTGLVDIGGHATGNIETGGDTDWFRVTLVAGTEYRFYVQGSQINSGYDPGGTLSEPLLTVRDAQGLAITSNQQGLGDNALIDFTAPASGTYFLEAGSAISGATGSYTISAKPYVGVDVLADYLTTGFWTSGVQTQFPTPHKFDHSDITVDISTLNPTEQTLARAALSLYASISPLTFTEVSGAADITFSDAGTGVAQGGATGVVNGVTQGASVQISSNLATSSAPDDAAFQIYLHEIGHALGLGHSGPYNAPPIDFGVSNIFADDTLQWTVMTDEGWPGQALANRVTTPQEADIAAIQQLYGANNDTRPGDTTYGFNNTAGPSYDLASFHDGFTFTIYDSGGVDTLDASGFAMAQTLDLRPGHFSSLGGYADNVAIYPTTTVENGVGGAGADTIIGNDAANVLTGGGGNDVIDGGAGWNQARYSGPQSAYVVTLNADGSVSVADQRPGSPDGHDQLTHVQTLVFSDGQDVLGPTTASDAIALDFPVVLRESTPTQADQAFHDSLAAKAAAGSLSASQAAAEIVQQAAATSSVATLAYEFFTGSAPSAGGMDYLVSPTGPNPDNLNSAYYQGFNTINRYINFASNLGRAGAGSAQFAADYGALTPEQAMTKAYQTIFGGTPSADKVNHLLYDLVPDGNGGTETRLAYFETYGQDGASGVGTKAAMVGWLLAEAVAADLGTYAKSNDAFLTDVALHNAAFGVDIIGHYAQPSYVYQPS